MERELVVSVESTHMPPWRHLYPGGKKSNREKRPKEKPSRLKSFERMSE